MIKQALGLCFGLSLLVYGAHILAPADDCERIEHSAAPLTLLSKAANYAVAPWTDDEALKLKVELWGLKARLGWVKFVQKQFFHRDGLVCPWSDASVPVSMPALKDLPEPGGSLMPADLPAPTKEHPR